MSTLELQVHALVVLALAGASAGVLFDVLRTLRWAVNLSPLSAALADLLFWLLVTAVGAGALLAGNWGELRLYVPLAVMAGVGLYFLLASSALRYLLRVGILVLTRVAQLLWTALMLTVMHPLLMFADYVWRLAGWLLAVITGVCLWALRPFAVVGRRTRDIAGSAWGALLSWLIPPVPTDPGTGLHPDEEENESSHREIW